MTMVEATPADGLDCLGARVEYHRSGVAYEAIVKQDDDGFYSYTVCRLVLDGDERKAADFLAGRATRVAVHGTEAVFHDVDAALSDARHNIIAYSEAGERLASPDPSVPQRARAES